MIIIDYYHEIKSRLLDNEIYSRVKDYSKERHRIISYFETGKLLYEAGSKYGEDIIGRYSERLINEVGKKYTKNTLFRMRQFYIVFRDEKVAPVVQQLTWSHCLLLLPLEEKKIIYYSRQVIQRNLSKRQLMDIIKNKEYERLPEKTKNNLTVINNSNIDDFIKNPIIIKNSGYIDISEKVLQKLIL